MKALQVTQPRTFDVVGVGIKENEGGGKLLAKLSFDRWGNLPRVLDFSREEVREIIMGTGINLDKYNLISLVK